MQYSYPLVSPHANCYLVPGLSFEGGIFKEQQTTFVWRLVLHDRALKTWTFTSNNLVQHSYSLGSPHANCYLGPELSFEGEIFKAQQTTFVWRLVLHDRVLKTWTFTSNNLVQHSYSLVSPHANCYLGPELSCEGEIFKAQQTTLV